jgi:polar amino acid transport system permease protein
MKSDRDAIERPRPSAVRLALVLVALTAILSLAYAVLYFSGGPLGLSVVSQIYGLALSPDQTLVAGGTQDGDVYLWEVPEAFSSAYSSDQKLADTEPWAARIFSSHNAPVIEVAFTSDGTKLVSVAANGQVRYWDVASGEIQQALDVEGEPLNDVALDARASTLASVGDDGVVRVWDLQTGQEILSMGPNPNTKLAVALNTDGSLVAAGDGINIEVWDVQTGESVRRLESHWEDEEAQEDWLGHDEEVTALAFSPDNQLLASGSADTTIIFWDLETGELAWSSAGHWATVTAMVFWEDGSALLSGGQDNKLRTLRLPGGNVTATFEGHLTTVNGLAYGPLPDTILSVSDDGTLRVWETANQRVIHIEWSRYGFQPVWGRMLGFWMLISGVLSLVCLWGLWRFRTWSHLLALALYLLGPIVVIGLPLLEVMSYPLPLGIKFQIAWPLMIMAAWYIALLAALNRGPVAILYEAPRGVNLSEQLVISQRTLKTRFGIYSLAVWIGLLVFLFSMLRRFNLDIAFMGHFLPFIMGGAGLTVLVSAASIVLAVILALLGALGRLSRNPIANGISSFYISLIRGTPLLVQIFIWYLGLPRLGLVLPAVPAGILALGVNYGAYMTEIFRAGIQAIGKGQHEAAEALGMSRAQTFRRIVLPQAFRIVIPPIGNEFIAMMKDSSLVSVMAVWELTFRAQKIGRQNFRNLETFLIAAAFYWILTVVFQFLQGNLEEYMARGERR